MSAPSPFEVARGIGNNLASGYKEVKDTNAIDRILSEAVNSGDPSVLQSSIGKILSQVSPERQKGAVEYLQNSMQSIQKRKEAERLENTGRQAAKEGNYTYGAPPQVQAQQVKQGGYTDRVNQIVNPGQAQGMAQPQLPSQQPTQQIPDTNAPSAPAQAPVANGGLNLDALSDDQLTALLSIPGISQAAKEKLTQRREDKKDDRADKREERKEVLAFHKESEKYDEELLKQYRTAKAQGDTIKQIESAISSGNVKPSSWANILKGFGKLGDKISEALVNKDEATLQASIPQLLEGWKEVFGVRLTDADLRLLQDKLPSIGKNPEANKAIVSILRKYADMTVLRNQIASQIKEDNKGLRPLGYADKIEKRYDEMVSPVRIINPNTGKEIEIPAYKLSDAIKAGAKLANG